MKDEYNFSDAKRGAVIPLPTHQTEVRLRLDNEVLDWMRTRVNEASGGNYQELLNSILRTHIQTQGDATLMRVITEDERSKLSSREEVYARVPETGEAPVVARQGRVVEEVVVGKTAADRNETAHIQGRK